MDSQDAGILFERYKIGDLTLSNRFVMCSMTRCRCDPKDGIPTDLHVEYYSQRASAGLIMTECSPIAKNGQSFMGTGGIYTDEQVEGWRKVTDAVHAKGGKIFIQIWHAGRSAHPDLIGEPNIGPSPIAIKGDLIPEYPHKVPREMTKEDIKIVLEQFKKGALNAKKAGFDGIELHGANGYLVDEFLRDGSNHRKDEYGGSVEKRARFCLEAIDILIDVFGRNRVGIKLSPVGRYQDMYDSNPLATYTYLLQELDKRGIAYVQLVEPGDKNTSSEQVEPEKQIPNVCKALRPHFKRTIIINNNQTPDSAIEAIKAGDADLVSFARSFIANPDYVERVKNGWDVNQPDYSLLYTGGEKGYIDYKAYKPEQGPNAACLGWF